MPKKIIPKVRKAEMKILIPTIKTKKPVLFKSPATGAQT